MKTWHKIGLVVVVIIGVLMSVKSCVDKKTPDITVAYIGSNFVDYNAFEENSSEIKSVCRDVNGDGEVVIELMEISFNEELSQADKQNSSQKLANAVGAGNARVYFIEKSYVINNASAGIFADLSSLGDGFKNSDGQVVAIDIEGNEKLEKMGIDTKGLYLAVRIVSQMDAVTDKNIDAKYESALNIAKYILK